VEDAIHCAQPTWVVHHGINTKRELGADPTAMRMLLLSLLLFHGLSALFGGAVLIAAPDGSILGLPLYLLADTPFKDFLVPGLILFTMLGLGSSIGWLLVYRRSSWAFLWVVALGVATVIWIVTQMIMLHGADILHAIYGGVGIGLVLLARHGLDPARPHPPGSSSS
jgi:hypothetical protein